LYISTDTHDCPKCQCKAENDVVKDTNERATIVTKPVNYKLKENGGNGLFDRLAANPG
jgi:hypothetical protein